MFTLPDLPFASNALEPHIDALTMEIHHGKHHATYVKNANDILSDKSETDIEYILKNLTSFPEDIRTKIQNNVGGHHNHSLFWTSLSPVSTQPSGELKAKIESTFGNMDTFKEKFTAKSLGRFGSGWVWLVKSENGLEIIDTPNQDSPLMQGKTPLLALDVWEHAYYLKYQNRRADYIAAWWNIINWPEIEKRYQS